MLTIPLKRIPSAAVTGIYSGKLADRMLYLAPDAAESFLANVAQHVVVSDMYRSGGSSLLAMSQKRGVQPAGFSMHNFGLAVDLDVSKSIKRAGLNDKADLDRWMAILGWHCHRLDHRDASEMWHFNWFPNGRDTRAGETSTAPSAEREIQARFGEQFKLGSADIQRCLAKLGLYSGAIDGKIGPLSLQAIEAFERAWKLTKHRERLQRTLAFVSGEKLVTP